MEQKVFLIDMSNGYEIVAVTPSLQTVLELSEDVLVVRGAVVGGQVLLPMDWQTASPRLGDLLAAQRVEAHAADQFGGRTLADIR